MNLRNITDDWAKNENNWEGSLKDALAKNIKLSLVHD